MHIELPVPICFSCYILYVWCFVICDSCGNYGSDKGEQIDIISFNCHENGQLDTSAIVLWRNGLNMITETGDLTPFLLFFLP